MNKYIHTLLVVLLLATVSIAGEHKDGSDKNKVAKTTNKQYDFISINTILMYLANDGDMAFNPTTGASGLEWPQGSGKTAVFEDGFVWGGILGGSLRVGGSTYNHGLQPGNLDLNGNFPSPDEKLANGRPRFRIYKVRKVTASTFGNMSGSEQERLKNDFMDWPVSDGAPFTNKDGVFGYQPDFDKWLAADPTADEPFMIGDEVLWFVSNDMDASLTTNLYGTQPIGIELQTMVWGYNQTGPLGNMVFTKYTFTNRGTDDLLDTYVAKWSDPDLGEANDDFVGVDTTLSLGLVYNGTAKDAVYGIPPADGYDFFQGPIVPSPGDTAIYNFGKKPNFKNLKVSSFAFYINGSDVYRDPRLRQAAGATDMYNYMQGLVWTGAAFIDPTTGLPTKFTLAGDPIMKRGWIDGMVAAPGDRRLLLTTGPFTLRRNETQEVVVATIVGRGSDRISSIQVVKYYDKFAQIAFDNNFDLPKAPPQPPLKASVSPNRIDLHWGDQAASLAIEKWNDRGYKFQGYNVYQLRFPSDPLSAAKRLATFDVVDNVATIFDEVIDERSGAVVTLPVQFGTDSDLERQFTVVQDAVTDLPLVNNQAYYFAVTAYSYNPAENAAPHVLETTPQVITVRPQFPNPGNRGTAKIDSLVTVNRLSGIAAGYPTVQIIDPLKCTGHTYRVTFEKVGTVDIYITDTTFLTFDNIGWNLVDVNTSKTLISKSSNYGGISNSYDTAGFRIGMVGVPYWQPGKEIASVTWTGSKRVFTGSGDSPVWWELASLWLGSSLNDWEVTKSVEIVFDRNKKSKGYQLVRGASPNYGYKGYSESPITIWDVSDPANKKQLSYMFLEQNAGTYYNTEWGPSNTTGSREGLFILDVPYSDTPDPKYSDPTKSYLTEMQSGNIPVLYAGYLLQNTTYPQADPKDYKWENGDKYIIKANAPFTPQDLFEFKTNAPSYSSAVAAQDVEAINVFPNPYFGTNNRELNKYQRFVTFNHLPPKATIRVFTVSGTLVKTIQKNDDTQIINWDLRNENGLPAGSGMYVIYIDMPDLGTTKILKLAVMVEAQFLDRL